MAKKNVPSDQNPRQNPRQDPIPAVSTGGDIALVLAKDADGVHILRRRSEEAPIEAGLLRPMREGKPIVGEVVSLTRRADHPMFYDVKSEFGASSEADGETDVEGGVRDAHPAIDGPAQVASEAYRKGWEAVWGRRRDRSLN